MWSFTLVLLLLERYKQEDQKFKIVLRAQQDQPWTHKALQLAISALCSDNSEIVDEITKERKRHLFSMPIFLPSLTPTISHDSGEAHSSYVPYRLVTVNGVLPGHYYIFISTEEPLLSPINTVLNIQKLEFSLQSPASHKTPFNKPV